jgi:hypothetical protein
LAGTRRRRRPLGAFLMLRGDADMVAGGCEPRGEGSAHVTGADDPDPDATIADPP